MEHSMPLLSLGQPGKCEVEGVKFSMLFEDIRIPFEDSRIPCLVTYGYLSDISGSGIDPQECLETFQLRRAEIEAVASALFDEGRITRGCLRLETVNPFVAAV
jgi:hypothetical protein